MDDGGVFDRRSRPGLADVTVPLVAGDDVPEGGILQRLVLAAQVLRATYLGGI